MNRTLYTMLLAGSLMLCTAPAVQAVTAILPSAENPTATRKATPTAKAKATESTKSTSNKTRKSASLSHRSVLTVLGLAEAKSVTSPMQRQRQLRSLQKQLQAKARTDARTRRARCGQALR